MKQQFSIMSTSGREVLNDIVVEVHTRLGDNAFIEFADTPLTKADEFFWRYLKFEFPEEADFVATLTTLLSKLRELPIHPDLKLKVF